MKWKSLTAVVFALALSVIRAAHGADVGVTEGWQEIPFKYDIQHPYDLKTSDRYEFDATNNIHHFWVYFTDKPHAPPPNKTNPRTEMKLDNFSTGERMFDGDVNVTPGTFACIGQVLDAAHGPVVMVTAHPDGQVTVAVHDLPKVNDLILTNGIGRWWNLKITNDTKDGGKIKVYVDNILAGTYPSRGLREYYFKCGVYSRTDSTLSDVRYRNLKEWVNPQP